MRLVIGVGNPDRGDDGVGRVVAQSLRGRVGAGVEVLERDGEVTALLDCLERTDCAYLVDAAASGAEPGTIHRLEAHRAPLPQGLLSLSTHGFGPAEAVELARAMGSLPATCVVYAVEGAGFEAGQPLSAPVARAAGEVARRILAELDSHRQEH